MDVLRLGSKLLNGPLGGLFLTAGSRLLYLGAVRKPLVRAIDRRCLALGANLSPIKRQYALIARAVVHTLDRLIARRTLSKHVARAITERWSRVLFAPQHRRQAIGAFQRQYGCRLPWFLVLSPGHTCNLACPGCYASSGAGSAKLPWTTLDRVMHEAKELWGVPLFVFSGGEPLLYRSQGKDLLDCVEKHKDCLFLMFTNGTLIDASLTGRLARLGNLTPALSVEGWQARTDAQRGPGTFDRVLAAMAALREAGVPFGLSVTVTRDNYHQVLSDTFLDFFVHKQGAFYVFLFQYTPIGRDPDWSRVPSPEQRRAFWQRSWEVVEQKCIFLLDFWNHGPLVEGCIAAGRERGYLYIDWNGQVMPCVFMPYAAANVQDVYAQGGTLNDVWEIPFFSAIREWQREYGYGRRELSADANWMRPCPFRDHHRTFQQWLAHYHPEPEDGAAAATLANEVFCGQMIAHGEQNAPISQEIWEQEYT
jgi:MoaA/NifB/PqqE/SkfB family radical SAM enzyme